VLDQALLLEQPQRLPQRCPAGPEPAGELFFDQPLARHQRAAEDLVAELTHRELDRLDGASMPLATSSG
jgi:hypothetical protein